MTSQKKPGLLDRAKQLANKLFTKRNMAIAAPVVVGAALSSKRVRDAVGDAAKSTGAAIASAAPTRKQASTRKPKPAASTSAKRSAAGKVGAKSAKPAAAKTAKPKATARPKPAKPRAKAAPTSDEGSGNA